MRATDQQIRLIGRRKHFVLFGFAVVVFGDKFVLFSDRGEKTEQLIQDLCVRSLNIKNYKKTTTKKKKKKKSSYT